AAPNQGAECWFANAQWFEVLGAEERADASALGLGWGEPSFGCHGGKCHHQTGSWVHFPPSPAGASGVAGEARRERWRAPGQSVQRSVQCPRSQPDTIGRCVFESCRAYHVESRFVGSRGGFERWRGASASSE